MIGKEQKNTVLSEELMGNALKLYGEQKYPQAMEEFVKCMKDYEKSGDTYYYCSCVGYIANIYNIYQDYQKAFHYLEQGYNKSVEMGYAHMQCNFLSNMVKVCCESNNLEGAKKYYKLQTELSNTKDKTIDDTHQKEYFRLYNYARILTLEGKYDKAIEVHNSALQYARKNKMDSTFILFQQNEICNLLLKEGKYDEVLEQGKECLAEAQALHNLELIANAYQMLTKACQYTNRNDDYRYYKEQYRNTSDSVYNVPELNVASSMLYNYEDNCNKEQISSLNSRIRTQLIAIIIVSILVIILIVMIFRILYYNRRLRNMQRILFGQKQELLDSNKKYSELLNLYVGKLQKYEQESVVKAIPQNKDEGSTAILSEDTKKVLQQRILKVLNDNETISNPDFNLTLLANAIDSNTRYVSFIINEMYGKNFKTVINEIRIRKAEGLLSNPSSVGQYTIQAIYESVGYTNAASFIRSFKKINGMTPSEFQKVAMLNS